MHVDTVKFHVICLKTFGPVHLLHRVASHTIDGALTSLILKQKFIVQMSYSRSPSLSLCCYVAPGQHFTSKCKFGLVQSNILQRHRRSNAEGRY